MIERRIAGELERVMEVTPAIALLGPRQVGKTTLAQSISKGRSSIYLDLESPGDLLKLRDPLEFLSMHTDKLVIVDEIQRSPELFPVLRGLIDKNRRAGRKGEQYLLLGSASMDLLRQSSESLAGRISYIELAGLSPLEVSGKGGGDNKKLWLRGGFPESYLAQSDGQAMDWIENLIRTYLERDVPQMGFQVPASRLRRLWTMLAHLQGEPINYSKLAANLEVDVKKVTHYVDMLVDLLLVRKLEPWHANVKKRLVKSPRIYVRDSGILHGLLGIESLDGLLSNPVLGKSWEGFVIENILSVLPRRAEAYFYRTSAGAEIDLLIKHSNGAIWAVEIKSGLAPKITKGFHLASVDVGACRKFVVYGGGDEFPIEKETTVLSLKAFLGKLESK